MNSTIALLKLLGVAAAGSIAIILIAQTPPASHETPRRGRGRRTASHDQPHRGDPRAPVRLPFLQRRPEAGLRVDHYCSHLNADVFQCVIYDSAGKNARLIGVEYIISEALFNQLPETEKKLWHSHRYEVMSGQLTAPGLSDAAEKELMQEFVSTYGKTWNLWQVDRGDPLPLGLPKLMMGFTADGQADPSLVAKRDRDLHVDSSR